MTRRILILVVVVIAALAVAAVYGGWFRKDSGLQGSGTVEARNIRVGSKVGGRILEVRVREGDHVQPGQTLITFDDKELEASLAQARANAQKSARGFRSEEIQEAAAAAKQAKADYDMHVAGYRKEDIDAAKADVDRATADETRAHLDFQRYDALAQKDLVSKQQRDTAEANWKIALAAKENAQHKLDELQRGFRPEEIAMAQARYQQVQAPTAATVEVLDVRPGDLIAPNTPVATLLESDQIYVRIYVPETELNRVSVGQKTEIHVDPFQKQSFNGVVEQINQQAEFLPRNVQTREERVHQVFGVKVRINDPAGRVLAGMAADVKLKAQS